MHSIKYEHKFLCLIQLLKKIGILQGIRFWIVQEIVFFTVS